MVRDDLKRMSLDALRNRDPVTRMALTGILARFTEEEKAAGFQGFTETSQRDIVERYVRSLEKAIEQLGAVPVADQYRAEIELLRPYLPQRMDEAATRALVTPLASSAKGLGQFIGMVMKQHKGQVDPELVRRIGTELGLR